MGSITRITVAMATLVLGLTAVTALGPTPGGAQTSPDDRPDGAIVAHDGPVVGAGVRAAIEDGPAVVVVAIETPGADGPVGIAVSQDDILAALPPDSFDEVHRFANVPAMALLVEDLAAIDTLEQTAGVARVDLDVGGTGTLDVTVPLTEADRRHAIGNDGDGVVVAVLDTGVDSDHPDLVADVESAGQACFGFNNSAAGIGFCPDGSDAQTGAGAAEDDAGHGTHVSGIVSGDGATNGAVGFAPGAELLGIKVLDDCAFSGCFYSFTLNVVAALDYIIANPQLGVRVINMSLSTNTRFAGDCDGQTAWTMAGSAAINTLWANGIAAFASAGNNGDSTTMGAPACLRNVISVGASDDADTAAGFTNASPTTDLFAPGVGVISSLLGGGSRSASGTSMASPSAAGCAALLIESGEATDPAAVLSRLKASGDTVLAANGITYPRIDCGNDQATVLPQPCVLYDSRTASGALSGPIPAGSTRTIQVEGELSSEQRPGGGSCIGGSLRPSSAILLVQALEPAGVGNLRVSAAGVAPSGGVVNYLNNGLDNANTITVPLGSDGSIDVFANVSATGVRILVLGFHGPSGTLDYVPLTPCAAFDSRIGFGPFAGPYLERDPQPTVDVVGFFSPDQGTGVTDCGVPDDATSVMVNLVAIRPPGGFGGLGSIGLSAGSRTPSDPMTPFTDLPLNNATSIVTPVDAGGTVRLRLFATEAAPAAHMRLVVLGYFTEQDAKQYTAVTPCAAFDSRSGSGGFAGPRLAGNAGVTSYDVTGTMPAAQGAQTDCGVPDGADAVLINLVAIRPNAVGNFRAYATGSTPTGGVLNFAPLTPAMNNSNAVVVPVSAAGSLDLFVNAPANDGQPTVQARGVILGYYD